MMPERTTPLPKTTAAATDTSISTPASEQQAGIEKTRRAVVLVSGGLDSATTLAKAHEDGFETYAISFDYGQRHCFELESAVAVCGAIGVADHRIVKLDLRTLGGSALTDNIDVPKDRSPDAMSGGIPITYVPARNTVFLSIAMGWAEVLGAEDLYAGVNAVDYSGYPDCRPEFVAAFQTLANLATKTGVEGARWTVHTPLIDLSKADIIKLGGRLGVDYSLTHSCYDPAEDGAACGRCDSCHLRREGFESAGVTDPTRYAD